ncbi:MAG: sigma 54-interacting transcriptional regulator [Clostridiales Family XIII bacterium]|jgi:transcriptional regulator with PAS, ATPase and Fis domain|nr:sigma 54-interacting transcriptional regulator [Clostridiales Family XIII bacterium]
MKKLLLVTKRYAVMELYAAELRKVFAGHLAIHPCYYPDDETTFGRGSGIAEADIVLITNPYSFPNVRRQVGARTQIINLDFAFDKARVDMLRTYPDGTEAMMCMNYYSSAHQAVYALYEAGVANLNLYIPYAGNKNMESKKFRLAIISESADNIPGGIPEVFDLGPRKISLATLLDIAVKADIMDDALEQAIIRYCEDISLPDGFLSHFYSDSSEAAIQLRTMMECIDYGIVIYGQDYRIINFNQNFVQLFELPAAVSGRSLADFRWENDLRALILSRAECRDRLFVSGDRRHSVMVSKEKINKNDRSRDIFILLARNITDVTKLETSMQRQISKRGHVAKYHFSDIKGDSPAISDCVRKARRIAQIDKPTLIVGESGTGKELFAQSIHNASNRAKFPFVAMNCAAIPSSLLESELFGYDEGAFTGARKGGKEGLFQMAHKGTLFLDEIGEFSPPIQAKLLRVLEQKEIMKVGGEDMIDVDVRILAATNRDLNTLVDSGEFRLDLYYRLNTLILQVPPLRERFSDIPLLTASFLAQEGMAVPEFTPEVREFLMRHRWRGNVRELRNCMEYIANIAEEPVDMKHLPEYILARGEQAGTGISMENGGFAKECSDSVQCREAPHGGDIKSDAASNPAEPRLPLDAESRGIILHVLRQLRERPAGRRGILSSFAGSGSDITEYRLRAIMLELEKQDCIVLGRGRAGCVLTPTGEHALRKLEGALPV